VPGVHPLGRRAGRRHDAGVGHHDIHAAELARATLNRVPDRVVVAYVGLDRHDPPVVLLDQPDRLSQILRGGHAVLD
jgi:hypothetical protein